MLADEVEDDVGAGSVSRITDGLHAAVDRRVERFIGAKPASEVEAFGARVEGDHAGTAQRLQDLHSEVAESANAKHDYRRPWLDPGQNLFDGVVGGDTRVGKRRQGSWIGPGRKLDDRADTRLEIFGIATIRRVETREERASGAVHVIADPTVAT